MLYRLFVAGIIAFWLVMGGLLVRTELFPNRADSLPIPVEYVGHLVFRHEQPSDLVLYSQRRRLDGSLHLQPKRLAASDDGKTRPGNLLSASGNFQLLLPAAPPQRVVFHGSLETDDRQNVRRVDLSISLHEPKQTSPGVTLHLEGRPNENQWRFQLTQGGVILREGSGTPDEILGKLDVRNFGVDPRAFAQVGPQASRVTMTAHRGVLRINDEDVETYVVTIKQGEGMETSIHVNQLGQILALKTFLGYDLYDESLVP